MSNRIRGKYRVKIWETWESQRRSTTKTTQFPKPLEWLKPSAMMCPFRGKIKSSKTSLLPRWLRRFFVFVIISVNFYIFKRHFQQLSAVAGIFIFLLMNAQMAADLALNLLAVLKRVSASRTLNYPKATPAELEQVHPFIWVLKML